MKNTKPKALVVYGQGIGCHQEVKYAFETAGAEAELVHVNQLISGDVDISNSNIINFSGGFLQGDIMGAGMAAASQIETSGAKDRLLEYVERGGLIYGQCNGFQLLVKTGLLPGIGGDYSKQTVTLTHNNIGNYRVDLVKHRTEPAREHFAFEGLDERTIELWCRHGEGKIMFHTPHGSISREEGEANMNAVLRDNVLLWYVDDDGKPTEEFPHNPNGSAKGIAGLVDSTGRIFAHMAHPEVSIYYSRHPDFFRNKDFSRRERQTSDKFEHTHRYGVGATIFNNIVNHLRR